MKLRRLCCLFGFGVVGLCASAFAEDRCQHCGGLFSAVATGDVQQQVNRGQREAWEGAVSPTVGPIVVSGSVNLFFQLEPLFWRAVRDGAAYGVHGFKAEKTTTSEYQPAPLGRVEIMGSGGEPGLRAGVGARLGSDGWEVSLHHTYFRPKRKDRRVSFAYMRVPFETNFASDPGFGDVAKGGEANWRFNFNVLDMEVGRSGTLSPCLILRPYVGTKVTWQRECDDFLYLRDAFFLGEDGIITAASGPYYASYRRSIFGIGLRGGCGISWLLCRGFSIYGDFSWSALWANCSVRHRVDTLRDVKVVARSKEVIDTDVIDVRNKGRYSVKGLCEFECGLNWETSFCRSGYHFGARLGWAEQVWVNWVENWALNGTCSNLSLYGPKVTLRLDF